ncbi:MAG: hypothetical protein ACW98D_21950 [Promethearchaeota archaeon]|jgi:hypothetical protein
MFKDNDLVVLDENKLSFKNYFPPDTVYRFSYVKRQKKLLRKQHGKEVIFFHRYRLATEEEIKNATIFPN